MTDTQPVPYLHFDAPPLTIWAVRIYVQHDDGSYSTNDYNYLLSYHTSKEDADVVVGWLNAHPEMLSAEESDPEVVQIDVNSSLNWLAQAYNLSHTKETN